MEIWNMGNTFMWSLSQRCCRGVSRGPVPLLKIFDSFGVLSSPWKVLHCFTSYSIIAYIATIKGAQSVIITFSQYVVYQPYFHFNQNYKQLLPVALMFTLGIDKYEKILVGYPTIVVGVVNKFSMKSPPC